MLHYTDIRHVFHITGHKYHRAGNWEPLLKHGSSLATQTIDPVRVLYHPFVLVTSDVLLSETTQDLCLEGGTMCVV